MRRFFRACQETQWGSTGDRDLLSAVKGLHALSRETLIGHLPVLLNVLFNLLPAVDRSSEVPRNIVRFLVFAVNEVGVQGSKDGAPRERNPIMHSYLFHVFKTPVLTTGRSVHSEVLYLSPPPSHHAATWVLLYSML